MSVLLDILAQEHTDMRRLLDLIKAQADRAEKMDFGLLHEVIEYCLVYPDQYHHPKEDLIYEALRLHDPDGAGAVDDIVSEHRELAIATRELATVLEAERSRRRPAQCLRTMLRDFIRGYRDHMRKEDQEFFPYARLALAPEEWSGLEAEIDDPADPFIRSSASRDLEALLRQGSFD